MLDLYRSQMTIWPMPVAFWIPKATFSHSAYVTPITLPLQQWLHERTSFYIGLSCPLNLKSNVNGASAKECAVTLKLSQAVR